MSASSDRSPMVRVGLLLPLLVSLLLGGCTGWRNTFRSGPTAENAVPGRFYFETRIDADRILVRPEFTAERDDVSDAELAAACQVHVDWNGDHALSTDVIMTDDPVLLRSAELLDGDFSESDVAREVESRRNNGDDNTLIVNEILQSDGAAAADEAQRYLDARSEPPSASAAERFVVYLTARKTTELLVVRMAISPLAQPLPSWGRDTVRLRRVNGEQIRVDVNWCLADDG